MAKKRTLPENIRKYKQEYLRLGVQEARLTQQLYRMKKRIKSLAEEEQLHLSEKALLSKLLQGLHQQKTDLESQPASKQRDTQLKRVEKEYKQVKAKHSRNQYQLDKLEVKKDKDNVVKLLVKEARLDQVRIRLKAAYETWMQLEQMQQYEITLLQSLLDAHRNAPVLTDTTSELGRVRSQYPDSGGHIEIFTTHACPQPEALFKDAEQLHRVVQRLPLYKGQPDLARIV
jgi:chromosome segregation ATPase